MITHTTKGTYENGKFTLEQTPAFEGLLEVVVVFVEVPQAPHANPQVFSFAQSLALTRTAKGSLSQSIIEDRREEKW